MSQLAFPARASLHDVPTQPTVQLDPTIQAVVKRHVATQCKHTTQHTTTCTICQRDGEVQELLEPYENEPVLRRA